MIAENKTKKIVISDGYRYELDKTTGEFFRFGNTEDDDPDFSPIGPEILDLEISTSVHPENAWMYPPERLVNDGGCKGACSFCYKGNGKFPTYNMNLDEFKKILHLMSNNTPEDKYAKAPLNQLAFGIMNIDTNPDFFAMADYAKAHGVMPNFTMHGLDNISDDTINRIASTFGACAVSVYQKEASYNMIKRLTDAGMKQVNIHFMIAEETYATAISVMSDVENDPRLQDLNALVFLSLKRKGSALENDFTCLATNKYEHLVNLALQKGIRFGFDSCGAHKFLSTIAGKPKYAFMEKYAEPCESACFSSYISARGDFYACSFCEGEGMWKEGIPVLKAMHFVDGVWNHPRTQKFREVLLKNGRNCPMFDI